MEWNIVKIGLTYYLVVKILYIFQIQIFCWIYVWLVFSLCLCMACLFNSVESLFGREKVFFFWKIQIISIFFYSSFIQIFLAKLVVHLLLGWWNKTLGALDLEGQWCQHSDLRASDLLLHTRAEFYFFLKNLCCKTAHSRHLFRYTFRSLATSSQFFPLLYFIVAKTTEHNIYPFRHF